jgi:phage recombination protein Bet
MDKDNKTEITNNKNIDLIKQSFAKNATDAELRLFLYMSSKYQLDILTGQIYLQKYWNHSKNEWNPAKIQTSRDGFLSIAHRKKTLDGQKAFDGLETETGNDENGLFAISRVYRKDCSRPFVVKVYFNEYDQKQALWKTKPITMISKVAESQALRKAFDISGIYDSDELPREINIPTIETGKQIEKTETKQEPIKKEKKLPEFLELWGEELHNIIEQINLLRPNPWKTSDLKKIDQQFEQDYSKINEYLEKELEYLKSQEQKNDK